MWRFWCSRRLAEPHRGAHRLKWSGMEPAAVQESKWGVQLAPDSVQLAPSSHIRSISVNGQRSKSKADASPCIDSGTPNALLMHSLAPCQALLLCMQWPLANGQWPMASGAVPGSRRDSTCPRGTPTVWASTCAHSSQRRGANALDVSDTQRLGGSRNTGSWPFSSRILFQDQSAPLIVGQSLWRGV